MQYFSFKQILSVAGVLIALLFLYFHRVILGLNFFWEDFLYYQFPAKYFVLNNLKEGILNFWNPYIFSGTPTLSDIQLGIFYPFNLLLIPFAKPDIGYMYWLLEMQTIFHLFLGGIFMYILLRYLKVSHFSSLVGGVIFALLPFFIVHLKHVNIVQSAIWLPLIFLFFHRALHNKSFRDSALAGLFFGISTLAGHLQISYYIALFLIAYFIYFLISEKKSSFQLRNFYSQINKIRFPIRELTLVFIVFIIALGLSAIELIPYWEFTNLSIRTTHTYFSFSSAFSLNPFQFLITSILPHFFGGESLMSNYWGVWNYWEMTAYMSVIVIFLLFIGYVFLKTQKFIKFLLFTAFVSLLLALGYYFFAYPIAYFILPGLKMFRVPARFILLYSFSLVIIFSFILDFLTNKNNFNRIKSFFIERERKLKNIIYIFLISIFTVSLITIATFYFDFFPLSWKNISPIILKDLLVFLLLFFSLIFILKKFIQQSISIGRVKILIVFLIIADLFWFGFEFNNGNTNPKDFYKEIDEITYLKNRDSKDCRVTTNNIIYPNAAFIYKFNDTSGYPATSSLLRYNEFTNASFWQPESPYIKLNNFSNRAKLLNQYYILSDKKLPPEQYENIRGTYLYKFQNCLPRVLLVHNFEIEKNPEEILKKIDEVNFDPLETVILEKDPGLVDYEHDDDNDNDNDYNNNKVEITKYTPDYIEIRSKSANIGILFLSEIYYPGWEAYVDGTKTEIYQANYLFRAITLQAGEHKIEFIYEPKVFKIGGVISLISLLTAIVLILIPSKNKTMTK